MKLNKSNFLIIAIAIGPLCYLSWPYDVILLPLYRKCVTVYTHHSLCTPLPWVSSPPPHAPSVTSSLSVLPSWQPNTRLHDHKHDYIFIQTSDRKWGVSVTDTLKGNVLLKGIIISWSLHKKRLKSNDKYLLMDFFLIGIEDAYWPHFWLSRALCISTLLWMSLQAFGPLLLSSAPLFTFSLPTIR